jgi:two-component system alkaline phosphatase synthesis response regulator PhoP
MTKRDDIRILLIDDEEDILELIGYNLSQEGFQVFTARNGVEGIAQAKKITPHLIILDIMMPEMDGIEACEIIRSTSSLKETIIIFLTARDEDFSQLAGFNAGADDFIKKPVKPKILIYKIMALLRRSTIQLNESEGWYKVGSLAINCEEFKVINNGQELTLPRKEFELLVLLTSKPGNVFSKRTIIEKVWDNEITLGGTNIDNHISKLRTKIGSNHFQNIKGVGYKFVI